MSISKVLVGLCLLSAVGSILGADLELPCYIEGMKCLPGAFNSLEAKTLDAVCGSTAIADCLESAKNKCMGTEAESALKAVIDNYKNICTCMGKVQTCGGGIMAVLKNPKTDSATFNKLCNETEDLEQCLDESISSCPSGLVSTWKAALAYIKTGCEYAACYAEVERCSYKAMRVLQAANNSSAPGSLSLDVVESICSDRDVIVGCFDSSVGICPSDFGARVQQSVEIVFKACDYIPCAKKLGACAAGFAGMFKNGMMTDPKTHFGTSMLQDMCSEAENLTACINSSTPECPSDLMHQWSAQLNKLTAGCDMLPCVKKIGDCGSKVASMLSDRKNSSMGINGALEDLCSERENLTSCINSSTPECPSHLARQWSSQLHAMTVSCDLLPCAKKLGACAAGFAGMFKNGMMTDPKTHFGTSMLQDMCSEAENLTACINSSTPECPSALMHQWSAQLNKLTAGCDMLPCVKKIGDCGSKVASMLTRGLMSDRKDYSMPIIGALEDLCSERENLTSCINSSTPECPSHLARQWSSQLHAMTVSCDLLPCTKQLGVCNSNLGKTLMKPFSDPEALHTICNDIDDFKLCVQNATSCPSSMRANFTVIPEKYQSTCPTIAKCTYSLQDCAGESAKAFLQTVVSGRVDITAAERLCDVKERLVTCFNQSATCPRHYVAMLEASLSKMSEHCKYLPCVKKVQQCGVSMFEGIDIRKLNKETLMTFCSNVVDVERCLANVGDECPEEVSDKWKEPMTMWADRCASIVKRYRCDQQPCKNGGVCVATVSAVSCRCKDGFEGVYCEIDTSLTTTASVTEHTPGDHGATVVYTASVLLASLGASCLLAAQYATSVV